MSVAILITTYQQHQPAIQSVRKKVFIDEQGIDPALEWDGQDQQAQFAIALHQSECIGTARLLDTGRIGRMAVLAPWRRRGVGSQLLQALLDLAAGQGHTRVHLAAQTQVCEFYEQHGFIRENAVFIEANIPHQAMYREL